MMKHDNFASTPCIFPPTYYCTTQITILKRLRVVKEQKINAVAFEGGGAKCVGYVGVAQVSKLLYNLVTSVKTH